MSKILIFAGTIEGRELATSLDLEGHIVHVCVATEYGEGLIPKGNNMTVTAKRLTQREMEQMMLSKQIEKVIDATHPYAVEVSKNIKEACKTAFLSYTRLIRGEKELLEEENVVTVESVKEAVHYLQNTRGNVFVTTGSKELEVYTQITDYKNRVFARVLSTPEVVTHCKNLGFEGRNLICMQGPFCEELNYAMLKQFDARYLVTKECGDAGGFAEKVNAAKRAGATLVLIQRPVEEVGSTLEEIMKACRIKESNVECNNKECSNKECSNAECNNTECNNTECNNIECSNAECSKTECSNIEYSNHEHNNEEINHNQTNVIKRTISCVGIGMGAYENMTLEAITACEQADLIIGAGRMLKTLERFEKPIWEAYDAKKIHDYVKEHTEYNHIVVALSGDVGFYSGAKKLRDILEPDLFSVDMYCGISSVVYFCAQIGIPWEQVKLVSNHGRTENVIGAVKHFSHIFVLVGGKDGISNLCQQLLDYDFKHVRMWVGQDLSYENQHIETGTPREIKAMNLQGLQVCVIENSFANQTVATHGIPDEAFIRGKVPMTKEEIRSISLSKLRLTSQSVVYDIGAGTGSVAIECALQAINGQVYAIEKKDEAADLIEENKRKFGASNLQVIKGFAPEALEALPKPTHAFIGGSSGNLGNIITLLQEKNPLIRIVINAIALETIADVMEVVEKYDLADLDIAQVAIGKSKTLGKYHMMMGLNPVLIVSFGGER